MDKSRAFRNNATFSGSLEVVLLSTIPVIILNSKQMCGGVGVIAVFQSGMYLWILGIRAEELVGLVICILVN
ncbi:hypothetical protein Trydic_g985 [Trypoxylus dichotomus]